MIRKVKRKRGRPNGYGRRERGEGAEPTAGRGGKGCRGRENGWGRFRCKTGEKRRSGGGADSSWAALSGRRRGNMRGSGGVPVLKKADVQRTIAMGRGGDRSRFACRQRVKKRGSFKPGRERNSRYQRGQQR